MYYRAVVLAACLAALSCSRRTAPPGIERLAILRFENLSSDISLDWEGRAFSEIITRELTAAPNLYAVSFERLHAADTAFGRRPLAAPGISAEHALALAAGANRVGYGDYTVRAGRLEIHLTIEDPQTGRITETLHASGAPGDPVGAASQLARQLSSGAAPYSTRNSTALRAYVSALEAANPGEQIQRLREAVAADPAFAPPYHLLGTLLAQQRDTSGALALLDQAWAHRAAMPELERARIALDLAGVRGDAPGLGKALAESARLAPNDPVLWRDLGRYSVNRRNYPQAVTALQRSLAIEPDDITALNQLGYAAAFAGDLDAATRALQRYAALRPTEANPLDSLGDVNLLLGRLPAAENCYRQAAAKTATPQNGGELYKAAMARLMTGDRAAADALAKQFVDSRRTANDPMTGYYQAQWAWIEGRRKEGYEQMAAFARGVESGAARQAASDSYSQLAIWSVALGDRPGAARMAQKALPLTSPSGTALAAVASFLSQPSASSAEWAARAERQFPVPAQKPVRDLALAYALLADRQFTAAAQVLQPLYDAASPTTDDSLPVLLAWADLDTGKPKEAAALLRFNPLPSLSGMKPLMVFWFPRLFYLRGRLAALAGNAQQAQAQFQLFRELSGNEPLSWGEEAGAAH